MPSSSPGHAAVGIASGALGAVAVGAGLWRPAGLSGSFVGTPVWALVITGGCVLLLAGMLVLVFTFRPPPEPTPVVPAYIAFASRMEVAEVLPPLPVPRAAVAASAPAPRLPTPEPPARGRVAPKREDMTAVDTQIRELTRRINKAGVMLATGQLSQQGYLVYVEDIKRQRGQLEAQRVRAELNR